MRKLDREENPLFQFRKKKRWTRVELSRKSGLGYATLDFLETGVVKRVSPRVMSRLLPLGLPEDLPEEFKRWKTEMEQRALAAQDEKGGVADGTQDGEKGTGTTEAATHREASGEGSSSLEEHEGCSQSLTSSP
jgi:transcriptional regulator with XRE-family HTH domain